MIPILYEINETNFSSNGLGRLRDCITCTVTEERNGIYECDFDYPMTAEDFNQIQIGRIIGVTHDDSGEVEPFDIVSYSRPIDGVVTFHCVHISYRQSYLTVTGTNINSLSDAFTLLGNSTPTNPFTYQTDVVGSGYLASADGTPRSVRQMLGGIEGSILDVYGGEYEWSRWTVYLHSARGELKNFSIRYGVNMLDYNEEYDSQGTYSSCVPYWTDGETTIVGDRQDSTTQTVTGRDECVPLDVSDKFESEPTKAEVEAMGLSLLNSRNTALPQQNIHVEFVRLQDLGYDEFESLFECKLCDTINVIFPGYNATGRFKIVKTVWNVLKDRYDSMELGDLSTTLSEALGISNSLSNSGSGGGGSSAMVGEIKPFAGSTAPSGWLICDGSPVSRSTYSALFSVIGTTYGTGDGSTTFNLPDAAGKTLIGTSSTHTLGSSGGAETVTLQESELPQITGTARVQAYNTATASGHFNLTNKNYNLRSATSGTANAFGSVDLNMSFGSNGAHNNMQPFLTINYLIYAGL